MRDPSHALVPEFPNSFASPKLPRSQDGYRYYAGFSEDFVREVLQLWPVGSLVVDPWNGSGTTTRIAAQLGLDCVGFDLNPAMVVVARGQLLTDADASAIAASIEDLSALAERLGTPVVDDPLLRWFDSAAVLRIRGLQNWLIDTEHAPGADIRELTPRDAFWLTSLFHVLSSNVRASRTSNPTWVKGSTAHPAPLGWEELITGVSAYASRVHSNQRSGNVEVRLGSSLQMAGSVGEVDLVLGSPPYLTRIDYAVATRVELAVLGLSDQEQTELRRRLLGTTTVPRSQSIVLPELGETATTALASVTNHKSKASRTYYRKWLAQFLSGYAASMEQATSIMSQDGTIGLVVQDSYYKEVHLDLPTMTKEMLAKRGWHLCRSYDFAPRRAMAQINPRAVAYRQGAVPCEKALFFRR